MIAGLTFNHHGLAVRNDGAACNFLTVLGYAIGPLVVDPVQNVRLRLCQHADLPAVEIVMPGESGPSPLDGYVSRQDALLYHTCYEVTDRDAVLHDLETAGLRIFEVLSPTPAVLFNNRLVSFHMVAGFGLIELLSRH